MDTTGNRDRPPAHPREIWFPARRDGWGWGVPVAWQGWVALLLYAVCLALLANVFEPALRPLEFSVGAGTATALLMAVCWWKGERPRWRWDR